EFLSNFVLFFTIVPWPACAYCCRREKQTPKKSSPQMKTAREISHSMTANSLKSAEEVVPEDTVAAEKQITVGGIKEAEKPAVVVIPKDAPMDTMSTQLSILASDLHPDNPSSR
ncbi:hypothetical protein OESDEN_08760, partial [Oesophagostomum dentatum]